MKQVNKKKTHSFKYMGLGFQLIIKVFLCALIGLEIDKKTPNKNPWGLMIMSTIGVFAVLYYVIKEVSKKK